MVKYLRLSTYISKPFLIYDFATDLIWISLHLGKISFSFWSMYCTVHTGKAMELTYEFIWTTAACYLWEGCIACAGWHKKETKPYIFYLPIASDHIRVSPPPLPPPNHKWARAGRYQGRLGSATIVQKCGTVRHQSWNFWTIYGG